MGKKDFKREFSSILADVTERVNYLAELGVDQMEVDAPELRNFPDRTVESPDMIPSSTKLEKFIPHDDFIKSMESKRHEGPNSADERKSRNLFDSARLSGPRVSSGVIVSNNRTGAAIEIEDKMSEKTKLEDSLHPDISAALPVSVETLETVRAEIGTDCIRCGLCEKRTQVVNSVGNPNADLMFIGEAPGADEDEQGEPFVGRAGQLLTKMIEAIDLTRKEVFIGNINRCRPPGNRQPQADEAAVCKPFLLREIAIVRPKVIVVMGNIACQNLLETKIGITKLRGIFQDYYGVKVMPTFHPAYLLRDPRKKREVWDDLKAVRAYLNESR